MDRTTSTRTGYPVPLVAAIALAVACALPALATTYVPVRDADLADRAAAIAVVTVLEQLPPPAGGEAPSTLYRVAVEEVVDGRLDDELTLRVPGGVSASGVGWRVEGAPRFAAGERALLFLVPRDDDSWEIADLMLGAFHQVVRGGERLAVRDLAGAERVGVAVGAATAGADEDLARRFEPFVAWLRDHAAGRYRAVDYRTPALTEAAAAAGLRRIGGAFESMTDGGQCGGGRLPIRWFRFDDGGTVGWTALASGQPGMPGGGFDELADAFAAWNDDPTSDVRISFLGTGSGGDGQIRFDDPRDEIAGSFSCSKGGVLAIGGPAFHCTQRSYGGRQYRPAVGGKVVTQDGAGCFFGGNGGLDGAEVFAHELGHTLGLGHSAVSGALMRSSAYGNGRGAALGSDDRAALAEIYGAGGAGPEPDPEPVPPLAPGGLTATATSASTARLGWQDRSANESRFEIHLSTGSSFRRIGDAAAGVTAVEVLGLSASTTYLFEVRACNLYGCSAFSNTAVVTTPATDGSVPGPGSVPLAPAALAGELLGPREVRLSWLDRSDDETGFVIEAALAGGSPVPIGTVPAGTESVGVGGLSPETGYHFQVRARNDAGTSAPSNLVTLTTPAEAPLCPPGKLCLLGGRFEVEVTWRNQHAGGVTGVGSPIPATDESGFFTFFHPDNVELVVKMLDGRSVNGSFWVFYGGLSDVEFELRVRDTETGAVRTFHNPPGRICGRGETAAFPIAAEGSWVSGAAIATAAAAPSVVPVAGIPAAEEGGAAGVVEAAACSPGPGRLCLAGGRFEVTVEWTNQHAGGTRGTGQPGAPVVGGDTSGVFWFFEPHNLELVAKVIDGRAVNGHFWFFYGALTDVGYELVVRDTVTGARRTYHNPPGALCGRGDTAAF